MLTAVICFIILFCKFTSISAFTYTCDLTSSCGCSTPFSVVTSRIVGGEAASNHAWSWMVSLQLYGSHRCGASLLTPEYAVTAAHCVDTVLNTPSVLSILAGTNNLKDSSIISIQRRSVVNIISHPNYNPTHMMNDIAILQFSPLTTSSSFKPTFICLPNLNEDPVMTNSNLVAIGWGYTNEIIYQVSDDLRQVTVQALSPTSVDCRQSGLSNSSVQFCAGISSGGKDTCQGDSGGPLMAFVNDRWVLAGITSFGYGCAKPGYPGVYTRVSAFIPFINSYVSSSSTIITTISTTVSITESITTSSYSLRNLGEMIDKSLVILILSISFSCVIRRTE